MIKEFPSITIKKIFLSFALPNPDTQPIFK